MPSDTHVPAGPSLAGRFAAAIALTIGFYVLALALGAGLLAFAVVPWFVPGPQNIFISFAGLVLGGSILLAIVPRRHRRSWRPGCGSPASQQPRLLELIDGGGAGGRRGRCPTTSTSRSTTTPASPRSRAAGGC